jgi:hypothetical protein
MEADLTTTDANPPRRMTARTGDALLTADAPSRAACWSGGAEGGQPRRLLFVRDMRRGPAVCLQHCTGAGAGRIRNRYANPPARPAGVSGQGEQAGPGTQFRRGRFLNAPPFAARAR